MKIFKLQAKELEDFYSKTPGKDGMDRTISKALHSAITSYGVQTKYLTELIGTWVTAYNAADAAKTLDEEIVFRNAHENAQRYITDILRSCKVTIDGCEDLSLFRVLVLTWERFRKSSGEVEK